MTNPDAESLRDRLLSAARQCFPADDYHDVTTRRIADLAGANVSMIRYDFDSKAGRYEAMIRDTLEPMLSALDRSFEVSPDGLRDYLGSYYQTMLAIPGFPRLILKIIALREAPGRRFVRQLLDRGRVSGGRQLAKLETQQGAGVDPDLIRMAFLSLTITPLLLNRVLKKSSPGLFHRSWAAPTRENAAFRASFSGRQSRSGITGCLFSSLSRMSSKNSAKPRLMHVSSTRWRR